MKFQRNDKVRIDGVDPYGSMFFVETMPKGYLGRTYKVASCIHFSTNYASYEEVPEGAIGLVKYFRQQSLRKR